VKKLTKYDDLYACLNVGEGLRSDFCRAIVVVYSEALPTALQDHAPNQTDSVGSP